MWRSIHNYLRHSASREPQGWHPLLAVYYLTYACNLRCPYCSDGAGTPYWKLHSDTLPAERVLALLRHIRATCDHLVITGGEPLRHPQFGRVMESLPNAGFDSVVLTTIGLEVEPHLEAICRAVRYLVFSLETLDEAKADANFGRPGTLARILANIERARAMAGPRTELILSAVATPDGLDDLYAVYEFARTRGMRFALCPQLIGVAPHPGLRSNPEYQQLFDFLIAEKKRGQAVNGTLAYLRQMRDLSKFDCRPSTVLAVSPTGDVFYPCLEIGHLAGNLLEQPDLHALRRQGKRLHGPEPACPNQCQSACALGFASILDQPLSMLTELGLMARAGLRRKLGR
jgi:MoaA/NifB/PqqE/SkfB family radical SAM enzyme